MTSKRKEAIGDVFLKELEMNERFMLVLLFWFVLVMGLLWVILSVLRDIRDDLSILTGFLCSIKRFVIKTPKEVLKDDVQSDIQDS